MNAPAIPCGLVAKSFFNDAYKELKRNDDPNFVILLVISDVGEK